jgi:hypothetical protein
VGDENVEYQMHEVSPDVARAGAIFGSKMQEELEAHLGRDATVGETRDFALGALDIIFSATYGLVHTRESDRTAHSWSEAVMTCISDSIKRIIDRDFKIVIVSKDKS